MKATPKKALVQPLPLDGLHEYMGICPAEGYGGYWARGATEEEVRMGIRKFTSDGRRTRIVIVPKGAHLDEVDGRWMTWPGDNGHQDRACTHCTFQLNQK